MSDGGLGGITVEATWVSAQHWKEIAGSLRDAAGDRNVLIHVKLDTHSVDLEKYDLAALAFLEGRRRKTVQAEAWLGLEESSHHREGLLIFPGNGNEEWQAEENEAQLTVKGVAGVAERLFGWAW
ncbi:MAG: hypothetical protein HY681_04470 [Chloroflexi bacterium]|nr:hypothetical protein [Chloroflexota bacterium]